MLDSSSGGCDWQAGDSPQCVPCALCPCDTARAQAALRHSVYKLLEFLPSAYFTRYIFLIIFATNRDVKAVNSSCSFFSKFCKIHFAVAVLYEHMSVKRGG